MAPRRNLGSPEPSLTLHGSSGIVSSLQVIESGPLAGHLISGSIQTAVYLWDLITTKRLVTKFHCDNKADKNSTVLWTHFSARQSDELFVQIRDGLLYRWGMGNDQPRLLAKTSIGNQLSFCPALGLDEHDLICIPSGEISGNTSGVGILSQADFSPVGLFYSAENLGSPMRMVRVRDNQLMIAYESADACLWDIRNCSAPVFQSDVLKASKNAEKEEDVTPLAMDFDREKDLLVIGSASNAVKRFKVGPEEISFLDSVSLPENGVTDLKIRPDGKILTVNCWDFTARVFSWKTLKPLAVLDLHRDTIQCVEYAKIRDENCVILGGKDALISVWPLY